VRELKTHFSKPNSQQLVDQLLTLSPADVVAKPVYNAEALPSAPNADVISKPAGELPQTRLLSQLECRKQVSKGYFSNTLYHLLFIAS
jgi:hypothetical protein